MSGVTLEGVELDIEELLFGTGPIADEELAGVFGQTVKAETDAGQLPQPGVLWGVNKQNQVNFWMQLAAALLPVSDSPIRKLRPNLAQIPEVANVQQVPIPRPLQQAFVKNLPRLHGGHFQEAMVPMLGLSSVAEVSTKQKNQENLDKQRVTMWNPAECRKLSGNAAPFRRNLEDYMIAHPEWQVYKGQDQVTSPWCPDSCPSGSQPHQQGDSATWSWLQGLSTELQVNPESTRHVVTPIPRTKTVATSHHGKSMSHFLPGQLASGLSVAAIEKQKLDNQRVTIWNSSGGRKVSGNAAPFRQNLKEYLQMHPEWEVYTNQDKKITNMKKRKRTHSEESCTIPEGMQSSCAAVKAEAAQGKMPSPLTSWDMVVKAVVLSAAYNDDYDKLKKSGESLTSGVQIGQSQKVPIRHLQFTSQQPQVLSVSSVTVPSNTP